MNRIDRLMAMVVMLQSQKVVTGKEMAAHFEVSLRTIYRDINAICEAGIPVAAEAGVGYSILEGYHLPPVMFSEEEASALYLAALLTRNFSDKSVEKPVESALQKIQSVLPTSTREKLSSIRNNTHLLSKKYIHKDFRDDVILTVQQAITEKRVLKIEYYVASQDRYNQREIEPLALIHYASSWHIIAYCRLRKAMRDFRTDRIAKIEMHAVTFKPKQEPVVEKYLSYFDHTQADIEVIAMVKKNAEHAFLERLPQFNSRKVQGEWVEISFLTDNLFWLIPIFFSFPNAVKVVQPTQLKKLLYKTAQELVQFYQPK